MRILSVFGTRPEAIKMAPVALALQADHRIEHKICVTGQHREMLDQVMRLFDLRADIDLQIMRAGQDLFDVTNGVLSGMRTALQQLEPELVLVHGDTTTCFTAALAAFYLQIPVGHVEAGLRTGDLLAPFPEEGNRSMVGRIAQLHFAPTAVARQNLLAEGVPSSNIHVTGNTVIDALLMTRRKLGTQPHSLWEQPLGSALVRRIESAAERLILVTGHRRESFGSGFTNLCQAIRTLAHTHPQWLFVYPVHPNPNVRQPVHAALGNLDNVVLIEPQEYLPFVWLMDRCELILTDSGGIQEEGPTFGKPVLVTRDVTERPEALAAGTIKLVGTDPDRIIGEVERLLGDADAYNEMSHAANPFGDGNAAKRIAELIRHHFQLSPDHLEKALA